MILRKPYAIFIKYFKVLHMIMAVLMAFILYGSFRLYSFFRVYSIDYRAAISDFNAIDYLNTSSYILLILMLILTAVCLSVMFYKDKPKRLYIYTAFILVLVMVLYYFAGSALRIADSTILDVRVSKAFRDLLLLGFLLESVSFALIVVRATGFDIKQFDFVSDLQKLDISEKDSEEIEVALEFDKDEVKRNFKSKIRNGKYVYFEHKFIINIAIVVLIVAISIFVHSNVGIYTDKYSTGETFSASGVTLNIKDSYLLDSSIDGTKIVETEGDNAGVIVLVRFQVKGYKTNQTFNAGIVNLNVSNFSYSNDVNQASKLSDLGKVYVDQELTDEFQTYILAFEIPSKISNKKMYLKVNDTNSFIKGKVGAKNILVKLKSIDLRKEGQLFEKNIGETINFDDSILGSSSMVINAFEINNKFKLNYNYCYGTNKCMDSYEFVTPTATGSYFKTLMKISGNAVIDPNANIGSVSDFRTLLNSYGYINYSINNDWQNKKIDSSLVKPKVATTNDYFIEIPYDVKGASKINLILKIRNQTYKYVLK